MRIISTVPSQTELLADLGLDDEVVGITKFCVHPQDWYKSKTRIGGTKNLNLNKIKELKPDLVIANKEENVREQIEEIASYTEVYVSEIKTPEDNLKLIEEIGVLTDKRMTAIRLARELEDAFVAFENAPSRSAVYLIWQDPLMTIGGDTYINSIMQKCGLQNPFSGKKRYPETTLKELTQHCPELILLSSEPYPFKEKHLREFESRFPDSHILLVDGEAFSWYGTRFLKTQAYLKQLLLSINV